MLRTRASLRSAVSQQAIQSHRQLTAGSGRSQKEQVRVRWAPASLRSAASQQVSQLLVIYAQSHWQLTAGSGRSQEERVRGRWEGAVGPWACASLRSAVSQQASQSHRQLTAGSGRSQEVRLRVRWGRGPVLHFVLPSHSRLVSHTGNLQQVVVGHKRCDSGCGGAVGPCFTSFCRLTAG